MENLLLGLVAGIVVGVIILALLSYLKNGSRRRENAYVEAAPPAAFEPDAAAQPTAVRLEIVTLEGEGQKQGYVQNVPELQSVQCVQEAETVTQAPLPVERGVAVITLSREDVLDYAEFMRDNPTRFAVPVAIKEKSEDRQPDYLYCGTRCFGLVYERSGLVFHLVLRLDENDARDFSEKYSVRHASYPIGGNWYNVIIDKSFLTKKEVYGVIEAGYDATFREFYEAQADAEAEKQAAAECIEAPEEASAADVLSDDAEREYRALLERYKSTHYTNFVITRKEIAADVRAKGDEGVTVVERQMQPQLPTSLKHKGKTYAMLYGTDTGIMMTVRLEKEYAEALVCSHPEMCRARFPKGPHWYYVPIDGAFGDKQAIYAVLDAAREFSANLPPAVAGRKKTA